jgi:hypothetical protein
MIFGMSCVLLRRCGSERRSLALIASSPPSSERRAKRGLDLWNRMQRT